MPKFYVNTEENVWYDCQYLVQAEDEHRAAEIVLFGLADGSEESMEQLFADEFSRKVNVGWTEPGDEVEDA